MKENRILMLVNEFPPTGESGVQRALKFSKYLSQLGWEVFIVTPRKPTKTVLDYSLTKEIPEEIKVYHTSSLGIKGKSVDKIQNIRQNLSGKKSILKSSIWNVLKLFNEVIFPIDKQIGWVPFAIFKAMSLIKKHKISNIYITAYPFSAFLAGVVLKYVFGSRIFWIADYRDAWQFEPLLGNSVFKFRKKVMESADELVLRECDRVIFSSDLVLKRYCRKYSWVVKKGEAITNGYDEDDFTNLSPQKFDKFSFLYMGKIYPNKGNPLPVLEAISKSGIDKLQYIHIGTISTDIMHEIALKKYAFFHYEGYKTHNVALNYAAGADVNVVILNDDTDSEGVFPGKIFELIRIGKPIFAAGPRTSQVKVLIEQTQTGVYAYIGDPTEMETKLKELLNNHRKTVTLSEINKFSRLELTRKLATIFTTPNDMVNLC
jgi:glycosyltransferase involved in cell wall biosynthesis